MTKEEHPGGRWQRAARLVDERDNLQPRLRLAAMAGHIKHDIVAARRAALADLLADGRPHAREVLLGAVEAQLGRSCWGKRPQEALWRDIKVLRSGGLRIAYSRRAGVEGYYLQYPAIEQPSSHRQNPVDAAYVARIRAMPVADKNRQTFAGAAFALQQKRLLLAAEHPSWDEGQVDTAARRLVYGRHEAP